MIKILIMPILETDTPIFSLSPFRPFHAPKGLGLKNCHRLRISNPLTINKHIVFVFKVNDLSNIKMEDEDLVVILANLLNNAIEACENCIGKKVIKFKFMMEEQMIILSVKNTCNQMIIYHNNEIATTKMINQDEHGVGIKNIIRIVEKYNGEYVIQNDEDQFYFSIIIPL